MNINITLNLFCYTGFPWDLRDGYEKTNGLYFKRHNFRINLLSQRKDIHKRGFHP